MSRRELRSQRSRRSRVDDHGPRGFAAWVRSALLILTALAIPTLPLTGLVPGPTVAYEGPIFSFSEPNDGELLGSVFALRFTDVPLEADHITVFHGQTVVGISQVIAGAATVWIDACELPNGAVTLIARTYDENGVEIDESSRVYEISHPMTSLLGAEMDGDTLESVTLAVSALDGGALPYAVLVSRTDGSGWFSTYDVHLTQPPTATDTVATGTMPLGVNGVSLLEVDLSIPGVSSQDPVLIRLLVHGDAGWNGSNAITIAP